MRRFWFVLYTVTAVTHLIFALGVSFAARRLGAPWPVVFAALIALVLAASLRGRIRRVARDLPIPAWRLLLRKLHALVRHGRGNALFIPRSSLCSVARSWSRLALRRLGARLRAYRGVRARLLWRLGEASLGAREDHRCPIAGLGSLMAADRPAVRPHIGGPGLVAPRRAMG
jgi:hypothetical protein